MISRQRTDRGVSKLPLAVQEALLAAKRENPRRSIRQLKILLDYRRAQLWHDLKARIQELADNKQLLLV